MAAGLQARIERVDVYVVGLPVRRAFAVSGGEVTRVGHPAVRVLVKVTDTDGVWGWGEATPLPSWTYETTESIVGTLRGHLVPAVVGHPVWDLDGLHQLFDRVIQRGFSIGAPLAKAALDVAVHDLIGRRLGVPVGIWRGARRLDDVELAWVVSSGSVEEARASVEEGLAAGYRAFKVKIGLHSEEEDVEIVRAVRDRVNRAFLWVDANQAYRPQEALRVARRLADLEVAVFEQPLRANDLLGLAWLRERSPIPIALDETLRHPQDLLTAVRLGSLDVAIAKVQRSAGLWLSWKLCALAEDSGIEVMGSGLTDSDIGLAASLHLFSAFGVRHPADLNGRQFIESPYAVETVRVEGGRAQVPTAPGLGVEVDEQVVRRLSLSAGL
ncbi:MAG: enolase C-terminal domain-like protein [Armatimonadota bacterium]|nr:mandelate racemase [Armatimonadota bacterium]MDW8155626.1 enolase C-terminal domain-like protein [Armatimonadota bacterium]